MQLKYFPSVFSKFNTISQTKTDLTSALEEEPSTIAQRNSDKNPNHTNPEHEQANRRSNYNSPSTEEKEK